MNPKDLIDNAVIALGKEGFLPAYKYGRLCYTTEEHPGGDWIYARYMNKNCTYLRTFLFNLISMILPEKERFIPSECLDCYKVVVRPESLGNLKKLKKLMEQMDFPSKCGIERRLEVDAIYGGYWYCEGLDEGLLRLDQVEYALLGSGMKPFLKRGCTEYEADFGPSNTWKIKPGQMKIEKEAENRIVFENFKTDQRENDKKEIMGEWSKFTRALGMGPVYKSTHNYVTYGEKV